MGAEEIIGTRTRIAPVRGDVLHDEDNPLHAILMERAPDPAAFETNPPFFATVEASNGRVDSYGTFMDLSTLQNFASDAASGVAVMDSHRTGGFFSSPNLNFGRSLTGELVGKKGEERFQSSFYTVPGLVVEGRSTEDYVLGMRTGIYSDISVGFSLGADARIECTICNGNMMEYEDCPHFPGVAYDIEDEGRVVALGRIINATLREYSLVYEGATPGAGIVKTERMLEAGQLNHGRLHGTALHRLERAYGRSFVKDRQQWSVLPVREEPPALSDRGYQDEEQDMADKDTKGDESVAVKQYEDLSRAIRDLGRDVGVTPGSPDATLASIGQLVEDLRGDVATYEESVKALESEAEDGRAYRSHLIDEAVKAATRATPPSKKASFDEGRIRRMLKGQTLDDIRDFIEEREAVASELFKAGRDSEEQTEEDGVTWLAPRPASQHVG